MTEDATEGPAKQWDAPTYDSKHSFVWQYGTDVLELLAARPKERILDLGCGTGHLTNKIAEAGAEVVGIDNSQAMIEQARKNFPHLQFEIADGTGFRFDEPFDAVFSNAAIHWMRDPAAVASSINRALKPGGRFVAEFGGKGNLKATKTALHDAVAAAGYAVSDEVAFRYYPSIGEYATLLEGQGFRVTSAAHFDRQTPLSGGDEGLRNWLATFADNVLELLPADKSAEVIADVENRLRAEAYREGTWFADYRRIRVIAIKE
jgi:trans-aconitate methyltransferase